jgi:ubiquinone/menaquinone biosynthesis C-methylase UbiE
MDHADHVALLRNGIPGPGGTWADFGSGTGAFTLALADLVGPEATIYSIDRDRSALRRQERRLHDCFPAATVHYIRADYTQRIELPALDGAVMANALHFQRDKESVVELLRDYLRPAGRFIVVEYNVEHGNRWVPHPLSFATWRALVERAGFVGVELLATRPSRFLGEIYSAAARVPQ